MEATEFERGTSRILVAVRIRPEKKPTNNSSPENQDKNHRYGAMYQKSIVRKLDAQVIKSITILALLVVDQLQLRMTAVYSVSDHNISYHILYDLYIHEQNAKSFIEHFVDRPSHTRITAVSYFFRAQVQAKSFTRQGLLL